MRVIERGLRLGQFMQQSHLRGALSAGNVEALDTPIVPVQRAPFASTRPNAALFTRWIQAKLRCRHPPAPTCRRACRVPSGAVLHTSRLLPSCRARPPPRPDRVAGLASRRRVRRQQLQPPGKRRRPDGEHACWRPGSPCHGRPLRGLTRVGRYNSATAWATSAPGGSGLSRNP
jgi:hypothetical protein